MLRSVFQSLQSVGFLLVLCFYAVGNGTAQTKGFIHREGAALFPIGFYEHPKEIESLRRMAESGVNVVHCRNREELDRAASVGLMGIVPLPLQHGATDRLRDQVQSMHDHPALAAWEGPDEIVWNFTAASMLHRTQKIHQEAGEWWKQTDNALAYSRQQASIIIPNMRTAVQMIRRLEEKPKPVWINEALESDLVYVRQYLDFVDITGCDIYPVKKENRKIHRMGSATDRWMNVGRGKPVWMILQAFAWSELGEYYGVQETAYPTFLESRFMAYDVIAHGARGILYWGSAYLQSDSFRQSIYALTRELAALQPFLTASETISVDVNTLDILEESVRPRGVKSFVRQQKNELLLILINEDPFPHMGVEVRGLDDFNQRTLELLYGEESVEIQNGDLATRMKPYEVKVFATDRTWEVQQREGRDFID